MNKLLLILLFVTGFNNGYWLQGDIDKSSVIEINANYKSRIESLETSTQNFEDKFENFEDKQSIELQRVEQDLKEDFNYLKLLAWVFGSLTVLGILVGLWQIFIRTKKVALEAVESQISKLIKEKKSVLTGVIDNHIEENRLKKEKKILVLTPKESSYEFLENFFSMMEFEKVEFNAVDDTFKLEKKNNIDLVLFDNESNTFDQGKIQEIVSSLDQNTMGLYFGSIRYEDMNSGAEKLSFTNRRMQLYSSILNTLKYQKILASNE